MHLLVHVQYTCTCMDRYMYICHIYIVCHSSPACFCVLQPPTLSPLPTIRKTSPSPRRISRQHPIFVSPHTRELTTHLLCTYIHTYIHTYIQTYSVTVLHVHCVCVPLCTYITVLHVTVFVYLPLYSQFTSTVATCKDVCDSKEPCSSKLTVFFPPYSHCSQCSGIVCERFV